VSTRKWVWQHILSKLQSFTDLSELLSLSKLPFTCYIIWSSNISVVHKKKPSSIIGYTPPPQLKCFLNKHDTTQHRCHIYHLTNPPPSAICLIQTSQPCTLEVTVKSTNLLVALNNEYKQRPAAHKYNFKLLLLSVADKIRMYFF
jgi:hypothetical protein